MHAHVPSLFNRYFTLSDYRYKAKLTPGTTRRGRAAKAAAALALSMAGNVGSEGKRSAPRTSEDVQRLLERLLVEEVRLATDGLDTRLRCHKLWMGGLGWGGSLVWNGATIAWTKPIEPRECINVPNVSRILACLKGA